MSIRFVPFFLLIFAASVSPSTFTVTRTDDRNATCSSGSDCSLREAVNAANNSPSDDTIFFASSVSTITLDNLEITISNAGKLTLNGRGADIFTIDGGPGQNRLFYIAGATVIFRSLTMTGGNGMSANFNLNGGAMYSNGGKITLDRVHITGNTANNGGFSAGIYFFSAGTAQQQILNSTFSANQTGTSCGAFFNSGAVITIVNSTFVDNSAQTGGAICNYGDLALRNVTIAGNTGSLGGGGLLQGPGQTNFANTIIAGNFGPATSPEILSDGTVTSLGNNLVGDSPGDSTNTQTPIMYLPSDIRDIPTLLGPLQLNNGQTPTRGLLSGSPAINAGSNSLAVDPSNSNAPLLRDQRGFTRIIAGFVDIGAFEANSTLAPVTISGRVMARNRAAPRVVLTLTADDGTVITALTNPFGYYRFGNPRIGRVYLLRAVSKQAVFASQVIYVSGDVFDLNLSGQ